MGEGVLELVLTKIWNSMENHLLIHILKSETSVFDKLNIGVIIFIPSDLIKVSQTPPPLQKTNQHAQT